MKTFFRNACAGAALLATVPAFAADLASAPAPMPVSAMPAFSWNGFYAGGQLGWTGANFKAENLTAATSTTATGDTVGFGVLAGYNMQFNNIVAGVEGDVGYADASRLMGAERIGADWNGHVRGRIGYAFDRALFFAAGGLALANFNASPDIGLNGARAGWSLGAGIDYALTNQLAVRLEYIHDDFGITNAKSVGGEQTRYGMNTNTVRAAATYRF